MVINSLYHTVSHLPYLMNVTVSLRVTTRALIVEFKQPKVSPDDEEEMQDFYSLDNIISCTNGPSTLSQAIGWAIRVKDTLNDTDAVRDMRRQAEIVCHKQGRSADNWSKLLLCAKLVSLIIYVTVVSTPSVSL